MRVGPIKLIFLLEAMIILHYQSTAYIQNDYHIIRERIFVNYYNPKHVNNVKFEMRFYNRTFRVFYTQFQLLIDADDLEVETTYYKLYSNEYRGFPIQVNVNFCKELEKDSFGLSDVKKHSNITNCPWKKGFYVVKDYVPDEKKFPPFIPHGRYKGVLKVLYHSELEVEVHMYTEVKGVKRVGNTTVYV